MMNATSVTNPQDIDKNTHNDELYRLSKVYIFLGIAIIVLALFTASISFIILIGLTPVVPSRTVTLILIGINSFWVLGLVVIVFMR